MARIDISARVIGDKELAAYLARLSSHDIPKAVRAGVKYAATGGKTAIAKNIRANYSLSSARVKQDVSSPQYRDGGQTAVLNTSRKPITAMQFKARQTRRGVTMAIYKGQRTTVSRAFIAKGLPFRRQGKPRMPIDVIHGPSIHVIYTGGRFSGAIQQATEKRIEEQLVTGILRGIRALGRNA